MDDGHGPTLGTKEDERFEEHCVDRRAGWVPWFEPRIVRGRVVILPRYKKAVSAKNEGEVTLRSSMMRLSAYAAKEFIKRHTG